MMIILILSIVWDKIIFLCKNSHLEFIGMHDYLELQPPPYSSMQYIQKSGSHCSAIKFKIALTNE